MEFFLDHANVQTLLFVAIAWCCACVAYDILASCFEGRYSERSDQGSKDVIATTVSGISGVKHDVFISFRGEDTRRGFTSHLKQALHGAKIQTYFDDELAKGDEIAPALLKAISGSKLTVIVFSKNYASSSWCLDELVHILSCRDTQFIIPIFYDVDPSVVRKQSGSYAAALVRQKTRFKHKLKVWREALTTAGNISGFESNSKEISTEAELVKLVVSDVLAKLNRKSQIESGLEEHLVGIEEHVQNVVSLLCLDSDDVLTVGIWGASAVGKTTTADVIFHRLASQFDACFFIQDVTERSETKQGLYELRDKLFSTLLKEENLHVTTPSIESTVRQRLSRTKALIVLDDVNDSSQVAFLTGGESILFGPGSRIIVTGRNKRMLGVDVTMLYKAQKLHCDVAPNRFHLKRIMQLCQERW